jgi:hypothetical protein
VAQSKSLADGESKFWNRAGQRCLNVHGGANDYQTFPTNPRKEAIAGMPSLRSYTPKGAASSY